MTAVYIYDDGTLHLWWTVYISKYWDIWSFIIFTV